MPVASGFIKETHCNPVGGNDRSGFESLHCGQVYKNLIMKKDSTYRYFTLSVLSLAFVCMPVQAQIIGETIATVADEGTSGMYIATYAPSEKVGIYKDDAEVFSFYVDDLTGQPYITKLMPKGGMMCMAPGDFVIVKTTEAKIICPEETTRSSSVRYNHVVCLSEDTPTVNFVTNHPVSEGEYIYLLTNMESNGGFGFTRFTGDIMRKGYFFIVSVHDPLATDIISSTRSMVIANASTDDTIYDQKGQQVTSTRAGQLYIQGGRKFVAAFDSSNPIKGESTSATHVSTRATVDIEDGDPVPFLPGEAGNDDGFVTATKPLTRGDANGDGEVNATDVELISDNILGKPTTTFLKKAADINEDKVINVIDIVGAVNMIK